MANLRRRISKSQILTPLYDFDIEMVGNSYLRQIQGF